MTNNIMSKMGFLVAVLVLSACGGGGGSGSGGGTSATPTPTTTATPTATPTTTATPTATPTPTPVSGVGALIWEDNFDTLDTEVWTIDTEDGCQYGIDLCGWGNEELQWYSEGNVDIRDVAGEEGNKALVLEARRETGETYDFTSGKVTTQNKLAVQYGMIEIRMNVPNVDTGLWPAAWMLGISPAPWPRKGEIDIMEMGHAAAERERQGHPDSDPNAYVGSNLIYFSEGACVEGNPTCAASTAYDVNINKPYEGAAAITDRFVIYRTYWTESQLRFTIEDNGVEHDLYESPFNITEDSNAFREPFYLLLNLAVGGNFTDAATEEEVTAITPAPMYIDYIRVYEYDGQGEVLEGEFATPETGTFGVFTDTTDINDGVVVGQNAEIHVWNTSSLSAGSETAYEGQNVISWNYISPGAWFGAGVSASQPADLSAYESGNIKLALKFPADVTFRIGIVETADSGGKENWIVFPANETKYGLVRDGEWGEATIPVSAIRADLNLSSLNYVFAITSSDADLPTENFSFAIDDIHWDGGVYE